MFCNVKSGQTTTKCAGSHSPQSPFFFSLLSRISFCRIIKLLTSALRWQGCVSLFIKPTLPICHYDCKKKKKIRFNPNIPTYKSTFHPKFPAWEAVSQPLLLTTPCFCMSTERDPSAASKAALWAMPGSLICGRLSGPAVTCCLEANKLGCAECLPAAQPHQL